MTHRNIFLKIFSCFFLSAFLACTGSRMAANVKSNRIKQLHFLGEYIIPYNQQFKNTTVGGLSGIDYNRANNEYYLISDDWSNINPARFYTAKILVTENGIDSVQLLNVTNFLQPDGTVYPNAKQDPYHTPDPEALRLDPIKQNMVWTSEGERFIQKDSIVLEDPSIRVITKEGKYIDSFSLAPQTHMYREQKGLRRNGVFEGLSFGDEYKSLYVSIEEPLYEDGPRAGLGDSTAWVRLLKYDVDSRKLMAEYTYQIDAVVRKPMPEGALRINGISDILEIEKNKLLVVERSFSMGHTDCNVRVYIADVTGATNIADLASIYHDKNIMATGKKLLLNMDLLNTYIGNIEGVSFGPKLPNGHETLIFVADNNFRATEKTQFLLFEVVP